MDAFNRNRPYTDPKWGGNFQTQIPLAQMVAYLSWLKQAAPWVVNPETGRDYDYAGFWLAQQAGYPMAQTTTNPFLNETHFPDYWKTPFHATFSNESRYAKPNAPHWEEDRLTDSKGKTLFTESKHRRAP